MKRGYGSRTAGQDEAGRRRDRVHRVDLFLRAAHLSGMMRRHALRGLVPGVAMSAPRSNISFWMRVRGESPGIERGYRRRSRYWLRRPRRWRPCAPRISRRDCRRPGRRCRRRRCGLDLVELDQRWPAAREKQDEDDDDDRNAWNKTRFCMYFCCCSPLASLPTPWRSPRERGRRRSRHGGDKAMRRSVFMAAHLGVREGKS